MHICEEEKIGSCGLYITFGCCVGTYQQIQSQQITYQFEFCLWGPNKIKICYKVITFLI